MAAYRKGCSALAHQSKGNVSSQQGCLGPPPCPPCPASLNFFFRLPERPHTFRPGHSRPLCLDALSCLLSPWALLPAPLHYRPAHRGLCRALGAALPCLWPAERALELLWAGHRGSSGSRILAGPGCLGSPGSRFQEPFMARRSCWPYFGMGLALPHMASSWPSLHWASLTLEPPDQNLVPSQGPHPSLSPPGAQQDGPLGLRAGQGLTGPLHMPFPLHTCHPPPVLCAGTPTQAVSTYL